MQRILLSLPDETLQELDKLASRKGKSRAEILRLAADQLINLEKKQLSEASFHSVFGLWQDDPMTDEEVKKIKDEWGA